MPTEEKKKKPKRKETRRANNEGSLYKDTARNKWVASVTLQNGKRKTVRCNSQPEAVDMLLRLRLEAMQGLITDGRMTVADYLQDWVENRADIEETTRRGYKTYITHRLIPAVGNIRLDKLTPRHVTKMIKDMKDAKLSNRTAQQSCAILSKALNDAVKWGMLNVNVVSLVSKPKVTQKEHTILDPAQARKFLDHVKGDRLEALYSVALSLGLRQAEALGLSWRNVDLENRTLRVVETQQRLNGEYILKAPKSRAGIRIIDVPLSVAKALAKHRERQEMEKIAAGDKWQDLNLVFCTPTGGHLNGNSITHQFQKHLAKANLPKIRFHDLRHSCASLLLSQRVTQREIMEVLGHSKISTTMDIYAHILPASRRATADVMDNLLFGEEKLAATTVATKKKMRLLRNPKTRITT